MIDVHNTLAHSARREVDINNKKGLHARAAAKFVQTVGLHSSKVFVIKDNSRVAGDAIMDLLMLAAAKGNTITIEANGPDATETVDALCTLVTNKFGENE